MKSLPQISIQPDWDETVRKVSDHSISAQSFWISCYRKGFTSVHGNVDVDGDQTSKKVILRSENEVQVKYINSRELKATCRDLEAEDVTIYAPRKVWNGPKKKPINAVTASSDGRLYAYCQEQQIIVGSLEDGLVQITMEGHLAEVTTVRFFPSNQVLLSGASDFQAKIWSVQDGSNPVTLVGHTAGITDTAIVSRGRNVLTSSRDGTVRLWHCGSGSTIAVLCNYTIPVAKMIIAPLPSQYEPASHQLDDRESDTTDKMVIVGLGDGSVRGIHVGTREELFAINSTGSIVSALEYDPYTTIALVGDTEGVVRLYELSGLSEPRLQWQRSNHAITALTVQCHEGEIYVYVSNADGSIYRTDAILGVLRGSRNLRLSVEYSGNELEPVPSITLISTEPAGTHRLLCCNSEGYIKVY